MKRLFISILIFLFYSSIAYSIIDDSYVYVSQQPEYRSSPFEIEDNTSSLLGAPPPIDPDEGDTSGNDPNFMPIEDVYPFYLFAFLFLVYKFHSHFSVSKKLKK